MVQCSIILGVKIIGNEEAHQIGSSVSISCSSDLAVQTIRWLNNSDNGQELFSNSGQQQLLFPIESVPPTLANTNYTCEVILVGMGMVARRNIIFQNSLNSNHIL